MFKDLLCKLTGKWTRQYAEKRVKQQERKTQKENESYVYWSIRKRAEKGCKSFYTTYTDETIRAKLERKGYTVQLDDCGLCMISWD